MTTHPVSPAAAPAAESFDGVGWHESSWVLRKGLDVIEDVPLQIWLAQWRLARQAPDHPRQSTSDAKSASLDRSPRASIT